LRAAPVIVLIVGTLMAFHSAATASYAPDYPGSALDVNRTGDAVQALSDGDFKKFFATQPAIGPGSVIARAPFAALAGIGHDLAPLPARFHGAAPLIQPRDVFRSQLRLYRFGVFPCLLALVVLAAAAAAAVGRRGRPLWLQLLVAALVLGLPLWDDALRRGHPECFLMTALVIGALLAAVDGHALWAAVLLGLALATKQWALLALPAVLLAVDRKVVVRTLIVTVGVALILWIPMVIGNTNRFVDGLTSPATTAHGLVSEESIWFQIAPRDDRRIFDGVEYLTIAHRELPRAVERASHPLIVLLAGLLAALVWRRQGRRLDARATFQLAALTLLLRCLFDPVTNDYYYLPFLAALALSEGLSASGLPILALLATAAFLPHFGLDVAASNWMNAFFLAWTIPLAAWLAVSLYRRPSPAHLRPKL
jgi:hypothetical protein